jgi:nucleotide-binding universal stress UspA family protein
VGNIETASQIALNNILYLTDFSEASEAAFPYVTAIGDKYGATIYAAHIMLPDVYACMAPEFGDLVTKGMERAAANKMHRVGSRLSGLRHETIIEWGAGVWPVLQHQIQEKEIDLVVLGTHGRTGIRRWFLGSVAEQVLRYSNVPVLTVGPGVSADRCDGNFKCVLFATDFTWESLAGVDHAVSMARENHARLVLLHVIRQFKQEEVLGDLTAAEAIYHLNQVPPQDAQLWHRPELMVKFGEPAEQIVEVARQCGADLIVLGIRSGDRFGVATHVERTTAHHVVVNASCPVLTVRG